MNNATAMSSGHHETNISAARRAAHVSPFPIHRPERTLQVSGLKFPGAILCSNRSGTKTGPPPPSPGCNKSEAKGKTATLSSKRGAERHVQAIAAGKLYRDKRGHFNLRNLLDMHVQRTLIY